MKKLKFTRVGDDFFDESIGAYLDLNAFLVSSSDSQPGQPCPPQLLDRLRRGSASWEDLECVETKHADDQQAQRAVRQGAASVGPVALHRYADMLGKVGGDGAVSLLTQALGQLLSHSSEFDHEARLASLAIAKNLLVLNPESVEAAECLARDIADTSSPVHYVALEIARETAGRLSALRTDAMRVLRSSVEQVFAEGEDDDELFVLASPIIAVFKSPREFVEEIYPRWRGLLQRDISGAAIAAWHYPMASALQLFADLLARLPLEDDLVHRLNVAELLCALMPDQHLEAILRAGLAHASPSTRLQALSILKEVQSDWPVKLAREALKSEPEPMLLEWLEKIAARTPEPPTRVR